MSIPTFDTVRLQAWLERMRAGDAHARDELLRCVMDRLHGMASKMLRRFPAVRRWDETEDVLQNALVRLVRALEAVKPDSTRAFFGLAAEQLRRELLDLARRYARHPKGSPGNPDTLPPPGDTGLQAPVEPAASEDGPDDLDRWAAFHESVERLPAEEREVVGLVFYHGWTQAQVAELFGVNARTVRRWWCSACIRLGEALAGALPDW
jgi:RNA polymerase sigma-70 factor (ECF subfamily)